MKSVQYSDHVAFTLNSDEHIVYLGLKILKETYHANLIPILEIIKNGQTRLLFSTEGMTSFTDAADKLSITYRGMLLRGLAQSLKKINDQPFWKKEYLDIRGQYIFIDMANGTPGFILAPVDSPATEDKDGWVIKFEKLIKLLSRIESAESSPDFEDLNSKLERLSKTIETKETDIQQEAEIFISYLIDKWASDDSVPECLSRIIDTDTSAQRVELRYNGPYGSFGIYIGKDEFIIGKGLECDGVISINSAISRKHARITIKREGCFVEDLGSTNHTWLNGQLLIMGSPARLKEDDMIRFANMDFQVHIEKYNVFEKNDS